uniref:Uncharacterized protein n=1 Tax=Cyprinus carpio carpio TaxID=630221 RepID=A0A9J7Z1E5_CYPCA
MEGKWVGQIFHSNFSFKSRGTAILIKKNVQFTATKVISDSNGRYVIVAGKLYNTLILLVNIYAPNIDDEQFISSVLNILPNLDTHQLIMGGDFNFVLDPFLDRSSINSFKYLGITITKCFSMLYKENILKLYEYTQQIFKKWSKL